jgi:anti-sigma B factor antagonist
LTHQIDGTPGPAAASYNSRTAMTLTERQVGDVTFLDLQGRLVLDDGDGLLRERINDLVARGRLRVVLNLRDVTYIDSCGLGVIISKFVSLRNRGGDLKLLHLSPRTHRVFEVCKLEHVFGMFDSEAAAIASFSAPQDV